jgi:RNA polymerase sigma-70 factor, ECF subfamily
MAGARLAGRLAAGEPEAFGELYEQYGGRLYAYLLGLTGRVEAAEDILQAVMLRVVRYRRKLRQVHSLRAWLYTLARNEACRHFGKAGLPEADGIDPDCVAVPEDPSNAPDREALRRAVARLAPERREVVSLKIWQGLTFGEIGEVTGVPANTAASRYRYALEDLRRALEGRDEG